MARRIFEFLCPNEHKFERLVYDHEHTAVCSQCKKEANRIISPVRLDYRMGVDTSMTTMADKWAKMHIQGAKQRSEDN